MNGVQDLAFTLLEQEPAGLHWSMPVPMCSAMDALAFLKSEPRVASLLLMGWTGILRPAEILGVRRQHLVLPGYVLCPVPCILLVVPEMSH